MSAELADSVVEDAAEKMEKAVSRAKHDFASIRTGRATPALVEKMPIDYYGTEVPMQQIAGFTVPEARQLVINPYDKGALNAIERAIMQSDLGLNPSNDGVSIRLNFPPLTQERRKDLVKVVKHMAEEGRVAVRGVRRSSRHDIEGLEKGGDLSKDDVAYYEAALDKITKSHEAEIDAALGVKEKELLED